MTPANITRLMTFAQHGQPKAYAASDMMRTDLEALVVELAEAKAKLNEAPIGCNRTGGPPGCSTTCGANPDCLILKSSRGLAVPCSRCRSEIYCEMNGCREARNG